MPLTRLIQQWKDVSLSEKTGNEVFDGALQVLDLTSFWRISTIVISMCVGFSLRTLDWVVEDWTVFGMERTWIEGINDCFSG